MKKTTKVVQALVSLLMVAMVAGACATGSLMVFLVVAGVLMVANIPLSSIDMKGICATVTQNPFIGRSRNKAGGVVFTTYKGQNVMKTKPLTVHNPDTSAQQSQRTAMRVLVALGRAFLSIVRVSFNEVNSRAASWSSWIGLNRLTAFTYAGNPPTPQPNSFQFGKGTLTNPVDVAIGAFIARAADIDWTDNSGEAGANASDTLMVAAITSSLECYMFDTGVIRSAGTYALTLPGATATGSFSIHTWFVAATGKKASDSQNILSI